jgi:hypothetical protein
VAGGLGPDTVAAAIARPRRAGVDWEPRPRRPVARRRTDPYRVRLFLDRAHAAGRSLGLG